MSWLTPFQIGLTQGLLMLGAVLSFALSFRLLGFPDLTVEGSFALGAGCYAVLVQHGMHWLAAILVACAAGAACGTATALLHVRFGVNKFLAGIIVVSVGYSLTLRVMAGPNISLIQVYAFLPTSWRLFSVLSALWAMVAIALLLFLGSRTGIRLRAVGSNPRFARSLGISEAWATIAGLAGCNALAALSGLLLADSQGFADVSGGQGVLILALAALAIGEAGLPKRRLSYCRYVVLAAAAGSLAYQVLVAFAVRAGLDPTDLKLATGILVLLTVSLRSARGDDALDGNLALN